MPSLARARMTQHIVRFNVPHCFRVCSVRYMDTYIKPSAPSMLSM